jgi:hypothetical protein
MHPLRRLTITAALVALIASVPNTGHAYYVDPGNTRVKVDVNWTNTTVYFNRAESRAIVAGSTAFLNRTPGWVKFVVTTAASYAGSRVSQGQCIKVRKPYYGQATFGFYTGGYCR